jgi:hypothetical protein
MHPSEVALSTSASQIEEFRWLFAGVHNKTDFWCSFPDDNSATHSFLNFKFKGVRKLCRNNF